MARNWKEYRARKKEKERQKKQEQKEFEYGWQYINGNIDCFDLTPYNVGRRDIILKQSRHVLNFNPNKEKIQIYQGGAINPR